MSIRRIVLGARSPLLVLAGLAASCGGDPVPSGAPPPVKAQAVSVSLAKVATGRVPRTVKATGTFHPEDEVTVAAKVAGRIAEIGPDVGDRAKPGALLARVDATDYDLMRRQKAAALAESLARLTLTALPEGDVDLDKLPSIEKARFETENAKAKLERARTLQNRTPPLMSEQDFADLETAAKVADSALRAARLDAQTTLAVARTRSADLAAATQQVNDAVHAAPAQTADWLVAERFVSAGDYVAVGRPLYRLLDADPMRLRVRVPERRMAGVTVGRTARVELAGQGKPLEGRVTRLRPEIDPATRTYDVEIEVANEDRSISSGAFAVAEIDVGVDENVPLVPSASIVTFAGIRKAFVVKDGKAEERRLTLGRRVGDAWEVEAGLKAGEEIVAAPPPGLVPGTPLVVSDAAPGRGK